MGFIGACLGIGDGADTLILAFSHQGRRDFLIALRPVNQTCIMQRERREGRLSRERE